MKESQWRRSADPSAMLNHLKGRASDRKLRLLACACVATFCLRLTTIGWRVVRGAEKAADARKHRDRVLELEKMYGRQWAVLGADAWHSAKISTSITGIRGRKIAPMVREVFGNPFLELTVVPAWLKWNDRTVRNLARTIYQKKDFSSMPILADALEDAGCDLPEILEHCRQPGGHVRGCWAIDLLLGKE